MDGEKEEIVSAGDTTCTRCGAVGEAKDINQIWAADALAVMRPFQTLEEEGHYLSDCEHRIVIRLMQQLRSDS